MVNLTRKNKSPGKMLFLILLSLAIISPQGIHALSAKCSQVAVIESAELLSYLGNVTFTAPGTVAGNWTLAMKTSIPFTFIGGWHVMVTSTPSKGQAWFQNLDPVDIHAGDTVSFRFRIRYRSRDQVPKVASIKWAKWTICGATLSSNLIRQSALEFLDLESSFEAEGVEGGSGFEENDNAIQREHNDFIK